MTDFAWTPGAGAYKHYPPYVNFTGKRLTVRGSEDLSGEHPQMGATVSIDLPDEVIFELHTAMRSSAPQEPDLCRYCDGHGIYTGKDMATGQEVELSCQYCGETGRAPVAQEPVADGLASEHEALKHDFDRLAARENLYLNESERFADALVQIRDLNGKNYDSDRAWALAMQLRASVALKGWMGLQAKAPETGEE